MISLLKKIISDWIRKDPPKAYITLSVVAFHSFFILTVLFQPHLIKKKSPQKLVVKTIQPTAKRVEVKKPSVPIIAAAAPARAAPQPKKPSPKKPPIPAKAPTVVADATKPKVKPAAKPVKKNQEKAPLAKKAPASSKKQAATPLTKATPEKSIHVPDALLQELEERIAKIDTKRDKIQATADVKIPEKVSTSFAKQPLQFEEDALDEISSYSEFLIAYLQQQLHLPDFGEVKIEITLQQDGSIERFSVIKAESDKNKQYLEESLPSLRLPEFKGKGISKSRQTFVLTFCNEL